MARKLVIAATMLAITLAGPAGAATLAQFGSERDAIAFCQGGGVVWLDFPHGLYMYKGSPHYGKGNNGAYVCETDAIAAGAHPLQSHR